LIQASAGRDSLGGRISGFVCSLRQAVDEARTASGGRPRSRRIKLTLDDLECCAIAAHPVGHYTERRELLARGYRAALERNDATRVGLGRFAHARGHQRRDLGFT